MKFINITRNTIYLDDVDMHLPYKDSVQELDSETIKKSKAFQLFVRAGKIEIIEIDGSRIERNLQRQQEQHKSDAQFAGPMPNVFDDMETSNSLSIRIKGHFEEAGGYAKVNRNIALGLAKLGVDVSIEAVGSQSDLNETESRQLAQLKHRPKKNAIHIDSIIPSFANSPVGRYNILYTTIESYTVPKQFLDAVSMYQEIWVVSDFCKEVLQKHGVKQPVFVIPDSVDVDLYHPDGERYAFRPALNDFVFVSVFGWSYRKGYDVLLKAYLGEFSADDPVSLLLVSRLDNNPRRQDAIKKEVDGFVKRYGGDNPAHLARCTQVIPELLMPSLYRACDAFVLFSRGEGFCLPYCEASLCGLPIIGTNCSGQTMFLNKKNSYLLDIDTLAPIQPGMMHVHYWDGQEFPALLSDDCISGARKMMRMVYEHNKGAKNKNKMLQKFVRENNSIEGVANLALNRLNEIWSSL